MGPRVRMVGWGDVGKERRRGEERKENCADSRDTAYLRAARSLGER